MFWQEEAVEYGVDPHSQFPEDGDNIASIIIPDTVCPYTLSANQLDYFRQQAIFNAHDYHAHDVFDDTAYLRGLEILHDFNQEPPPPPLIAIT